MNFVKENLSYLEELYQSWKKDKDSIPKEWQYFFSGFELGHDFERANLKPIFEDDKLCAKKQAVNNLIETYRNKGYLLAKIDPLGKFLENLPEFSLEYHGLTEDALDLEFEFKEGKKIKLKKIIEILQATYCNTLSLEYEHLPIKEMRIWLQDYLEDLYNRAIFDSEKKITLYSKLLEAEEFEHFLHSRFVGQKRFSAEGVEALIPSFYALLETIGNLGYEEMVLGMAHRGRLNILANIFQMPLEEIFAQFQDSLDTEIYGASGDVKYHRGYKSNISLKDGKMLKLIMADNPSHLEAVDGVLEGITKGRQYKLNDKTYSKVFPVLIHGDAAVTGQGVVLETLNLSQLNGYKTGGTLHIIINNQIGFTTYPYELRTMCYPSDVTKVIPMPIFRVNGDDVEACALSMEIAAKFRDRYKQDVVIEIVCYRRHGHNEGDEPSFTQPKMYEIIKKLPTTRQIYAEKLKKEGLLNDQLEKTLKENYLSNLQKSYEEIKEKGFSLGKERMEVIPLENRFSFKIIDTSFDLEKLKFIAKKCSEIPIKINKKLKRIIDNRYDDFINKGEVDWSFAETLAFGTLLYEGVHIRLSGEDSKRGTFSHRHAAVYDIETEKEYIPLNSVSEDKNFEIYSSPLSEYAVLGFEYGYSITLPDSLVIWEAQFGDFINTAQVIVDQFIIAGETKWFKPCRLVLILPHGYEGQGPEHSSSYIERFLQLSAQENIQVCYPSTPSQYFHLLRRQMKASYIKPLIIIGPKSMLRHPLAISKVEEFTSGYFQTIIDDEFVEKDDIDRIIFCSGKIYYDLLEYRIEKEIKNNAIIRIEQLYPFHEERLYEILKGYPNAFEMVWVQEESRNRGAWFYISDLFSTLLGCGKISYIGRKKSASPATGSMKQHKKEQEEIIEKAFLVKS